MSTQTLPGQLATLTEQLTRARAVGDDVRYASPDESEGVTFRLRAEPGPCNVEWSYAPIPGGRMERYTAPGLQAAMSKADELFQGASRL